MMAKFVVPPEAVSELDPTDEEKWLQSSSSTSTGERKAAGEGEDDGDKFSGNPTLKTRGQDGLGLDGGQCPEARFLR
jgi:hypothetical protein